MCRVLVWARATGVSKKESWNKGIGRENVGGGAEDKGAEAAHLLAASALDDTHLPHIRHVMLAEWQHLQAYKPSQGLY